MKKLFADSEKQLELDITPEWFYQNWLQVLKNPDLTDKNGRIDRRAITLIQIELQKSCKK